jgi:Flp pilus assembly pilin Flp
MRHQATLRKLFGQIHHDERGAVSLETILVVGVIALPILIYLIKIGWPRIKTYFTTGMSTLDSNVQNAQNN